MLKRKQTYNQLALISLILTAVAAVYYLLVFIFPQLPINPLRPVLIAAPAPGPSAVAAPPTVSDQIVLPPTWTPTPLSTALPARPTFTPEFKPTRTPFATSTPTLNPLIPTRSPYKYTANTPVFTADFYGAACGNWGGVGGQVFDVDGSPLKGVSVVGWGGPIAEQGKTVSVSGNDSHLNHVYGGNGAYEIYIGAPGDFDFFVTVYENGRPAAPIVKLRMKNDCSHDLVLINFQRNH